MNKRLTNFLAEHARFHSYIGVMVLSRDVEGGQVTILHDTGFWYVDPGDCLAPSVQRLACEVVRGNQFDDSRAHTIGELAIDCFPLDDGDVRQMLTTGLGHRVGSLCRAALLGVADARRQLAVRALRDFDADDDAKLAAGVYAELRSADRDDGGGATT